MSKIIISGSRTITDYNWLLGAIKRSGFNITQVVSGMEPDGADILGVRWAKENDIYVKEFPVTKDAWKMLGKQAGPSRNTSMSLYADAAIILRIPFSVKSDGSDDMFKKMRNVGKPIHREIEGQEYK